MSFLKKLIGVALPVIGGAVAGPAGAAIGGTLGNAVSKGIQTGSSAVGSLIGGIEQSSAAREATDLSYERNSAEAALQRNWASQEAATARQFNELQAQKQMDFQERLSSSAHQREVADLRAAGLNPILSGTGGMGSSTPVGASAHASAPSGSAATSQAQQVFDIVTPALSTAMNLSMAQAEIARKEAEESDIRSQTRFRDTSQVALTDAQIATHVADQMLRSDQAALTRAQTERVVPEIKELYSRIELQGKQALESKARTGKVSEETKALEIDRFVRKQVMELDKSPIDGVPLDVVKGTLLYILRGRVD